MNELKKKDRYYYARILPNMGTYDVLEMKIRGVYDGYIVCIEKRDKQAFLFNISDIDKVLFKNRIDALRLVQIAEDKNKKRKVSTETYYEEY